MRTNIVIDDDLIARAMQASGLSTKRATVEAGLRLLIKVYGQGEIRLLRGKVKWQGSLEEMRASRVAEAQTPYDEESTGL
jgi:Arc/MetJ family transcription regulator